MRKPARQPSWGRRLLGLLFSGVSALAIAVGNFIVRNPVLTGGASAFAVVMGFVSINALWYQPQAHNTVFIQTRPDFNFKAVPRPVLSRTMSTNLNAQKQNEETVDRAGGHEAVPDQQSAATAMLAQDRLQVTGSIDEMLPALAPNADLDVARLQQSLSALGIYKGEVDGFTGPQTREAVEQWQKIQAKLGNLKQNIAASESKPVPAAGSSSDHIKKLIDREVPIPQPHPNSTASKAASRESSSSGMASHQSEKASNAKLPALVNPQEPQKQVTSQDIVRVQAGLKAFGNGRVSVDGVPDQTTREAVREFQKLFNLPATGEIDANLIGKMREIGLIS